MTILLLFHLQWYIYLGIIAGFSIFGIIVQAITNKDKTVPKEETDGSLPLLSNSTTVETKKPAKSTDVETPKQPEARKKTLRELKANQALYSILFVFEANYGAIDFWRQNRKQENESGRTCNCYS